MMSGYNERRVGAERRETPWKNPAYDDPRYQMIYDGGCQRSKNNRRIERSVRFGRQRGHAMNAIIDAIVNEARYQDMRDHNYANVPHRKVFWGWLQRCGLVE